MNPYLQQILHDITTRLAALEQRTWVGLTDEDFRDCQKEAQLALDARRMYDVNFAKAIEAKLKEKNGG